MNKRKLLALVLTGVMAISTLAGCGSSDTKTSNTDVKTSETAETSDKNVLRVGMECAYAPFNWTQDSDTTPDGSKAVPIYGSDYYAYGYDVMMAKKICDELGYDLQIVRLDWDSLIPAVSTGQVDCVIAGQSITEERLQAVDFTEPYYYATIVTLVKNGSKYADAKSVADLAGATCTSQQSTIWYDTCLPQIENTNLLAPADSAPAMIMQLQTGAVDYVCTDMPTALAAVAKDDNLVILNFSGTDGDFQFATEEERAENVNIGISVQKGNTQLADAIDTVLSVLNEEQFNALMDQAISIQPEI